MTQFVPKPSLPPPALSVGAIGWVRQNFLSSPLNIALSFIAALTLVYLLPPLVQWAALDATWGGGDSDACKTRNESGDLVDAPGACWTFVKVRFSQLMFGLYYSGHPEQLWRPILFFALTFLLIASMLVPVGKARRRPRNAAAALLLPLIVPSLRRKLLTAGFTIFIFPFIAYALVHGEWLGLPVAETSQWGGFMLTFMLAAVGIVAALPLGILFALGRRSEMPVIRTISVVYIEFWRGTPLITILFMASVMLPLFFPAEVDFDKVARALIGITMFQSAYTAEAIRGGLQAISKGQAEAADAMGLGFWQKTGFIILPQALKISIPGIVNTFIELFKDTSLVLIIGLLDLLNMAQTASRSSEWKGYDLEAYVFAAGIYFVCCFAMSKYSQRLEAKLDTERRKN